MDESILKDHQKLINIMTGKAEPNKNYQEILKSNYLEIIYLHIKKVELFIKQNFLNVLRIMIEELNLLKLVKRLQQDS